jgi:hypothetical protein
MSRVFRDVGLFPELGSVLDVLSETASESAAKFNQWGSSKRFRMRSRQKVPMSRKARDMGHPRVESRPGPRPEGETGDRR